MRNPFKSLNPDESPPQKIEKGVLSQISFLKFLINIAKHFTLDMVKTGVESIDSKENEYFSSPTDHPSNTSNQNPDGSSTNRH